MTPQPDLTAAWRLDISGVPGGGPGLVSGVARGGELTRLAMQTYSTPVAGPGDDRAAALLGNRTLLPNDNVAGYLQAPPLLLVNLQELETSGFYAKLTGTIAREMWEKWVLLAALGSIGALMRGTIGEVVLASSILGPHRRYDRLRTWSVPAS